MRNEDTASKLRRDAAKARELAAMAYNNDLRSRLSAAADALEIEAANDERKSAEWLRRG